MENVVITKLFNRPEGIVHEHAGLLKSTARILFGIFWLMDALFKLSPDFSITPFITNDVAGQNIFFATWYRFWYDIITPAPNFWLFVITFTEFSLAICLIFGFMRKVGYVSGLITSLVIWGLPERFGGPYGPFSTNIGVGIIYAIGFLFLIVINSMEGTSRYSVDYYIEQKFHWWRNLAEFS